MRRDGEELDHVGEYLEIERPHRLGFTWGIAQVDSRSRVVIEISPVGEGCELTLVHELEPEWAEHAGSARDSWVFMLGRLAASL